MIGIMFALSAVVVLVFLPWAGVSGANLNTLFGVFIPYLAIIIFFAGIVSKVIGWAKSPVPFRIPTTAGQQKSLPMFKHNKLENPYTGWQAFWRMVIEVLTFRSLFRNINMEYNTEGPRILYGSSKWLWLFAIVFHYAFLTTFIRHLRFFLEPVPQWLMVVETLDSFFEIGLPGIMLSGFLLLAGASLLLGRRIYNPAVRYISLANDYFPLFLIIGIATTGILMRHFFKTDIVGVKEMALGLITFNPKIVPSVGVIFYIHLFLVSTLFAYFPFSKLMHLGGVFMSPTRNLANNSRAKRHVNPWNYPVKFHTYEAYEDDFREPMVEAGIPVDKPLPEASAEETTEEPAE